MKSQILTLKALIKKKKKKKTYKWLTETLEIILTQTLNAGKRM